MKNRHDFPNITVLHDDDVDMHTFEKIDASPSIPLAHTNILVQFLTKHMRAHRLAFERAQQMSTHELNTFWLRKTRKPVLSVLMVRARGRTHAFPDTSYAAGLSAGSDSAAEVCTQDGAFFFYRGMNLEVSMPTGSLCAERYRKSSLLLLLLLKF